ncbi:MAG: hypothetical protein V1784_03205 [bacterium]
MIMSANLGVVTLLNRDDAWASGLLQHSTQQAGRYAFCLSPVVSEMPNREDDSTIKPFGKQHWGRMKA